MTAWFASPHWRRVSEDGRKLLQAAWKRSDRNERSSTVLISGEAALVGRGHQPGPTPDEPELELILIEAPGGGLKISFKQGAEGKAGSEGWANAASSRQAHRPTLKWK